MFSVLWPFKLALGLVKALFNLIVFLSCVLTVMSFMGDRGWVWSLSTHFRMQYLLIQALALLLMAVTYWMRRKAWEQSALFRLERSVNFIVLLIFAGLNFSQIAPYYGPLLQQAGSPPKQTLKLLHINLFGYLNHNRKPVEALIAEQNPDIIDFVEYTEPWQHGLEQTAILKKYPYRLRSAQGHIGLYSKRPLRQVKLVYAHPTEHTPNHANIIAQMMLGREPLTILVAHPAAPVWPTHLDWQKISFQWWGQQRRQLGDNLLIVGDLNTAPWSAEFTRLLKETGLRDSQLGFGLQPSWPAFLPFVQDDRLRSLLALPFGIPIDHILVSDNILVLSRQIGPFVGSDHLPVIAEVAVRPKS